ncbi:RNA pseudouridine synthase 3, mitochondrial-like isoform X2 [Durio zibethinus]|uniref:RNA pseudouridine synthase 3, mitochondrial-like isoform X2 n=1 Tax=Durio zibethinus TaxID=66656 RepID=A0A6P5WJU1_DURZI|nr:RNA pseudouridine synthase 3, mitochondrial-like isoform X2 [Durio zibethinus]
MQKNKLSHRLLSLVRHYSRVAPPPPVYADPIIRVSNNVAYLGSPKQGSKPRQLLSLPPFPGYPLPGKNTSTGHVTAISWLKYYFDEIPDSAIQSHFNRGLVQMESSNPNADDSFIKRVGQMKPLRKVKHNEVMEVGARVWVPVSIAETRVSKRFDCIPSGTLYPNADEIEYLQRLVKYKDYAILVLNKPPKLPVKGSMPVHNSMDALAAAALSYDYDEGPKLVHRLDRESSGLLLMGRTKESINHLHWLFNDLNTAKSSCKILLDDGKTERVILAQNVGLEPSQEAMTEYRVLGPTINGCSWIELRPLTSRKHQLRVHCAEALGTPIVGDYKYGWFVHRKWKQMPRVDIEPMTGEPYKLRRPEGLDVQKGSVLSKVPLLHLHCRELVLPNIAKFLPVLNKKTETLPPALSAKPDLLRFVASMPKHMKISWNLMSSYLV